jgi:hypothetical protein
MPEAILTDAQTALVDGACEMFDPARVVEWESGVEVVSQKEREVLLAYARASIRDWALRGVAIKAIKAIGEELGFKMSADRGTADLCCNWGASKGLREIDRDEVGEILDRLDRYREEHLSNLQGNLSELAQLWVVNEGKANEEMSRLIEKVTFFSKP